MPPRRRPTTKQSDEGIAEKTPLKTPRGRKPGSVQDKEAEPKSIEDAGNSHQHFEFGGPIGAAGIVFGLPVVVFGLYFVCNDRLCLNNHPLQFDISQLTAVFKTFLDNFITSEALMICGGWMILQVLFERILPGEKVDGVPLPDKTTLSYIMSGHLQFWLSILLMGHAFPVISEDANVYSFRGFQPMPLYLVYDHFPQIIAVSTVVAYILSIYL
jgi:Delta14-sterol reductase